MRKDWFSLPQETIEAAQVLHQPKPLEYDPAAIFKRPDGLFVLGLLRFHIEWPPHDALAKVEELLGYEAVAVCDPLMGIWSDYEREQAA